MCVHIKEMGRRLPLVLQQCSLYQGQQGVYISVGNVSFTINEAGQVYNQTIDFVYMDGAINAERHLRIEITRHLQRVWACFQRYKMEIYDRPVVRLQLKVWLLKADVVEKLLYGCVTWNPNKLDYDRLRRVHHSMLLRCPGWRKRKRDDITLSYADALAKTASESVEATVPKRRILFAGLVERMEEERLPQRVMFGELVGGKGYSRGAREALDGSSEVGYVGLWNEIRRVTKGCSEGWQRVST